MFKFRENSVLRFNLLVIFLFTTFGIIIIGKAAIIMFIERDDWNKIKEKNIKHNVPIEAHRGNILADDGGLLVSTLPRYRMKFDFEYINKDRPEDEKTPAETPSGEKTSRRCVLVSTTFCPEQASINLKSVSRQD